MKDELLNISAQLSEIRKQLAKEKTGPHDMPTLNELCDWYFTRRAFNDLSSKRDREHNLRAYVLPVLGHHTEETLSDEHVERMLEAAKKKAGLGPQTLNHVRAALSKVINDAIHTSPKPKWARANPVRSVKKYEVDTGEEPFLSAAEACRLLQAVSPLWVNVFAVLLYLGLRAGEIRALDLRDVDLENRRLTIRSAGRRETTKTGKARTIPYPKELHPFLVSAVAQSKGPHLFGLGGYRLTKNWKSAALMRRALKRAKVFEATIYTCTSRGGCRLTLYKPTEDSRCPEKECRKKLRARSKARNLTFHDGRHISCSLHQDAGCAFAVLVKTLGHSAGKVQTISYSHWTEDAIRAELEKLSLVTFQPDGGSGSSGGEGGVLNTSARSSDWIEHRPSKPMPRLEAGTRLLAEPPDGLRVAKFWSAVAKSTPADCWYWTGGTGVTRLLGRQNQVHRVAYQLAIGPLGERQSVAHACRGAPLCCNPAHIYALAAGTKAAQRGEANGRSKLDEVRVAEIRRAHAAKELSVNQLAGINGVSPKAIRSIVQGKTWRPKEGK